jgi:BASS family bile acid:Na+ symporter
MVRGLEFLGRHATVVLALGVFLGIVAQPLAAVFRPFLMPAVWALLAFSMMRLDRRAFQAVLRKPSRLALVVSWMLVVTPVLMWLLVDAIGADDGLRAALILTAASVPLMSTPAIGLILGLDGALVMAVLVTTSMLIPFTLPVAALSLIGLDLGTTALDLMLSLGALLGTSALAAVIGRGVVGGHRIDARGHLLDGAAVLMLLVFAVALMDGITTRLFAEPVRMLLLTALSFAVYIGLMIAGGAVFAVLWRDRAAAMSAGLASGCRNMAIIIVVLPSDADPEIMTYFALAQFPIYIMPSLMRPVIGRALRNAAPRPISFGGGST